MIILYLAYRGSDIGQLGDYLSNFGGGPFAGRGIIASVGGILVAMAIAGAWFGTGSAVLSLLPAGKQLDNGRLLDFSIRSGLGASVWSLIWFFLGVAGLYSRLAAIAALLLGLGLSIVGLDRTNDADTEDPKEVSITNRLTLGLIGVPIVLSLIASLAPPIAKDTLLYHFAVPKAFIAQGSSAFIEGNIASYLALGTEMHVVWAMLLGGLLGDRTGEAAAGATIWLFFPLLLAAIVGWAREIGISRNWSLITALVVISVPTAFHVASSGYVDLSLALYVTLAAYFLTRWWKDPSWGSALPIAVFLGAALAIKLTTVFVMAAFALIVLLKARAVKNAEQGAETAGNKLVLNGFAALLLAVILASPWFIRTWVETGSPVFPFYMSILEGKAKGWDVERSNLFQAMNAQYGGADVNKLNYLTAPVRVSVNAQPEQPANYDGVLGPAFLIALPLLIWALWKLEMPIEAKIAAGIAVIMYLFWLFSSQQLRYLLPVVPMLAIAIASSVEAIGGLVRRAAQFALIAACGAGIVTSVAWFAQRAPVRVVLGGETRDEYLTRNLDYYSYYRWLNAETPPDSKVWLINMRRDTYNLDRPFFSDYLFEDWTLRQLIWESRSTPELKAKIASMGVDHILTRHDFLFDYKRSSLVDDRRSRAENDAKLKMAQELVLDTSKTVRSDPKFSLVRLY